MRLSRSISVQFFFCIALAATGLAQSPFKHPKMSSAVLDAMTSGQLQQMESEQQQPAHPSLNITPAGLQVYIDMVEVSDVTLADLRAIGVTIELSDSSQRLVQARVPPERLDAVAALPSVKFIRLPDYGFTNRQGSVGTEGDAIVRAHLLRMQVGATGAGVRVGVISDGIKGLSQSIGTGDLPTTTFSRDSSGVLIATSGGVTANCCQTDKNLEAGSEGTAMLEIVHDIAPGAQLFFANFSTGLEFNQAVNFLAAQTDIVIDDISFLNAGRYDGTGPISQNTMNALNSSTNRIRAYFTSAGNFRQQHYRGAFNDSGVTFPSIDAVEGGPSSAHLFTPTGGTTGPASHPFNEITVPSGGASIYLQWDDPFGASVNDYDLFVLRPDGSIVTRSIGLQTGSQNPTETVTIPNVGSSPLTLRYVIVNFQNRANPRTFDVFLARSGNANPTHQFNTPGKSVPNQADAGGGVLSVGAVGWLLPDLPEPFSSEGPTVDGRLKPEVVAPDFVSVSGAGGFPTTFAGTSAAAPHAAAVAALLLSQNPTLSRPQLTALLKGTAVDLSPPGLDNLAGFGRVDAFPTAPRGMIALDRSLYRTGDTLHLSATLQPGSALNTGDAYVFAALPPDWSTQLSLIPAVGGGFTDTEGLHPLALGFPIPSSSGEFYNFTFSGAEPPGIYLVLGVLTLPGQTPLSLDANHLDQTIIFDGTFFEFSP